MTLINKRIGKILASMEDKGLDALFITSPLNRRYMSGFTGSNGFIYLSHNKKLFLTDFRYIEQAAAECPGYEIINYGNEGLVEELNNAIEEDGNSIVGF